jgi:hypothetical protein
LAVRSSEKRSDGSSSGRESSSGSNSLGSLTSTVSGITSDFNAVPKVVVLVIEVVEGLVDSLGGGRASVLVLILVSELVVNASTVRNLSPVTLAVSLTVLNSVRRDRCGADIDRGSPVESHSAATNSSNDIDSTGSLSHGSADLVRGTARALSDGGNSEASLDSSVNLLSDLILDVALNTVGTSVSVEGRPVVVAELVLVSTSPFNQVASVSRCISSGPRESVALDGVQERLSINSRGELLVRS